MDRATVKAWAGRGAIVVAALAVIATSPARWAIAADPVTVPPAPVPSSATLVTIEASQFPNVTTRAAPSSVAQLAPLDAFPRGAWPGRAEYLVPAGDSFEGAGIQGLCENQGMCDGRCVRPPGAFVRVSHVERVAEWKIEAESQPQTVVVPQTGGVSFDVALEATRRVDVTAKATGTVEQLGLLEPAGVYDATPADGSAVCSTTTKTVSWHLRWDVPQGTPPLTLQWTVHATIRGYCRGPSEGPCTPPETEHVRVVSILPRAVP